MVPKQRLHKMESKLKKLDGLNLSHSIRYGEGNLDCRTFYDWVRYAESVTDIDMARNALYYGFQPLYDSLINEDVPSTERALAINVLNQLIAAGTDYLTGYYTGEPDLASFKEKIKALRPAMRGLKEVKYKTKFRNIDYYTDTARPQDILSFLRQFMTYSYDGKLFVPEYVVGCACGASEIVMPLSGLTESGLGFVRKSKRRYDQSVRLVPEHETDLMQGISGRSTVCVEDFVCTGGTLLDVMKKSAEYYPSKLRGVSLHRNPDYDLNRNLRKEVENKAFNLFRLGY